MHPYHIAVIRSILALVLIALLAACGTLQVGVERTPVVAGSTSPTATRSTSTTNPAQPDTTANQPQQPSSVSTALPDRPAGWNQYQNPLYSFRLQYPDCYGGLVMIEPTDNAQLSLISAAVLPGTCPFQRLSVAITQSTLYRWIGDDISYHYDPETRTWWETTATANQVIKPQTRQGKGWIGYLFSAGNADSRREVIAIPMPNKQYILSIGFYGDASRRDPQGIHKDGIIANIAIDTEATLTPLPKAPSFAFGQIVRTLPESLLDLWTEADGGIHVNERPKLRGGTLVTLIDATERAVQLRTAEGVSGWVHGRAEDVVTTNIAAAGAQAQFQPGSRMQVVAANGLPLRQEPVSSALMIKPNIPAQTNGVVQQVSGDWLLVQFDDGIVGWIRWYYNELVYITPTI